ncbi:MULTISPECIES: hypothetical protein [Paenibacillus]|uniref:hypothetical protein n=1 Tax=Paenibacillus TaxID=44249 RepID=UPI00096CB863|nr:hypothetical protein [Paenibacillus odorifer]OME06742.1 hypothetical protein BSK60_32170 [Paenibacillus odorifer]
MNWDGVFSRLSRGALKSGEITEDEYRELLIGGDVTSRLGNMIEMLREKKLVQLVKGAEFIDSITPEDRRYEKAIEKYNGISQSLEYTPEQIQLDTNPTYLTVYTALITHLNKHGRTMKYEELRRMLPMLTPQQINWGMWECEDIISHVFEEVEDKPA